MDVLCTFKINIYSQYLELKCIKDQWPYSYQDKDAKPQSGTSSILQSPKWWSCKGHGCSLHFQIQDREPKFGSWVCQRPLTISKSGQDAKHQPGTSTILQSPKWGLKGHGCSLHLQNKDKEPKFGSWLIQISVTISKSRSRCQTLVSHL